MNNWQPIKTAPKDGTEIMLYDGICQRVASWTNTSDYGERKKLEWSAGSGVFCCGKYEEHLTVDEPTHWKPLDPDPV